MTGFLTVEIIQTALETGLIFSLVALSLFISFSILDICDLSTDGCYTLGCAVGAMVTLAGHPILAIFASMAAGMISGSVTAILQTKFGVQSILAGIIVNTGLYTINLGVMGFRSNVAIFGKETLFTLTEKLFPGQWWKEWHTLIVLIVIVVAVVLFIWWFLGTRLGLSIRATGDSAAMVRASSINPTFTIIVGMCISNSLTGMAGSLIGQYNKSCDINLGTGMVTIALASLIIGEVFYKKGNMLLRVASVVLGSCLYRFIVSLALRLNVPTEAFKLVSAIIVAVAIAAPSAKGMIQFQIKKHNSAKRMQEYYLSRKTTAKGQNDREAFRDNVSRKSGDSGDGNSDGM